jgi:hypothetical protein
MSDTPETDAAQQEGLIRGNPIPTLVTQVDFARKLERERDEARAQLDRICKEGFGNDDSIGLEPTDDYILRKLNDLREATQCDWKQDIDGNWDTSCKQCMCFEYGPPYEQGYQYCHHCAATINFIHYKIEEEGL